MGSRWPLGGSKIKRSEKTYKNAALSFPSKASFLRTVVQRAERYRGLALYPFIGRNPQPITPLEKSVHRLVRVAHIGSETWKGFDLF